MRPRWTVVVAGLVTLMASLALAVGPYQQTREFRKVAACTEGGGCPGGFLREPGVVRDRQSQGPTTYVDANGVSQTLPARYELTWERPNGVRETREVSVYMHDYSRPGEPLTVVRWRDHTVAVEAAYASQWFLPPLGRRLLVWLVVAWVGAMVALWGLLSERRLGYPAALGAGVALLAALLGPHLLAYGWGGTDLRVVVVFLVVTAGLAWPLGYLLRER